MNTHLLFFTLFSWGHTILPAAYTEEDYRTYCAMRYIADLFFATKTAKNDSLHERHEHTDCNAPFYWSRDRRGDTICPSTQLNLTSGLMYAPHEDTLYCRFGCWTFTDQKKYLQMKHYTRYKGEKIPIPNATLCSDRRRGRWIPIYTRIKEHIVTTEYIHKKITSPLYAVTRAGEIPIAPPTFTEKKAIESSLSYAILLICEAIDLCPIQDNNNGAASSSDSAHDVSITIPPVQAELSAKESLAMWQALKEKYES